MTSAVICMEVRHGGRIFDIYAIGVEHIENSVDCVQDGLRLCCFVEIDQFELLQF